MSIFTQMSSLTFYLAYITLGASTVMSQNEVAQAMIKEEIIPDLIPVAPEEILYVEYPSGVKVELGNEITPTQAKDQPSLKWNAQPDAFYALFLTDPDTPDRIKPTAREFQFWLVGNIPGGNVDAGEILTEFVGIGPPLTTGIHRIVILVFKQPSKLTFDEVRINNRTGSSRFGLSTNKFALKYNLGVPVAGNFFMTQYDDNVPNVHRQLGIDIDTTLDKLRN